jgi:hypothetical protein
LELLFTLFGGKIDAKLIQLFFEDKGLYLTAKAFNELDEAITKERFVEILSYPDLLDVKLQEKFREQFRAELVAQKNRFDDPDEEAVEEIDEKEQRLLDSFFGDYNEDDPQMTDEESFNALFKTEQDDRSIFQEFEEVPDADKISESLKQGDQTDEIKKFRKNLVTVLDQAAHSFKNLSKEEQEEQKTKAKKKKKKAKPKSEPKEDSKKEKDILGEMMGEQPEKSLAEESEEEERSQMWQQFLRPDQMDIMMGSKHADGDEDVLMDEETLVDDIVDEEDTDEDTVPELKDFMINNEGFFVEEIFKGSDKKYTKALGDIQELENWDKATDFIEKNVFSPNDVDMTSEVAVDFTDRLQSYFDEYKT